MAQGMSFVGSIMVVIGIVCLLQSTGFFPESAMLGEAAWGWLGLALLVIGLALCVAGYRRGNGTGAG